MGLFNWGALPKAQDNAQTIDEAIAAAIVAHEHDMTAHLGDGESLQQHKNNEIIDHPAFSIPIDKSINQDLQYYFDFYTLDPFNITDNISISHVDGLDVFAYWGGTLSQNIHFSTNYFGFFLKDVSDISFDTSVDLSDILTDIYTFSFGLAGVSDALKENGFAFYGKNGSFYSYVKRNGTIVTGLISGIDFSIPHMYRAFYNHLEDKVYYYIDNNLVSTLVVPTGGSWNVGYINMASVVLGNYDEITLRMQYFNAFRKILTD